MQITNIRNKRKDITTDPIYLKILIRGYHKEILWKEVQQLDETDKLLERYKLPKLNAKHIGHLKRLISVKESELIIFKPP